MYSNVIIIGGGIAGLYSAYKIKKINPNVKFTILEKNRKSEIGGRMRSELFYGVNVAVGAGIGRKRKDKLLIHLLHELNVEYTDFLSSPNYANNITPIDVKETFAQFAKRILGTYEYNKLIVNIGYTDYENEDVEQTLFQYGMEDNYEKLHGMSIRWNNLLQAIVEFIGEENIYYSSNVINIQPNGEDYIVSTSNKKYSCNKIIVATTISSVRELFPEKKIYKYIHSHPFLRIYGKFSKESALILKNIGHSLIVKFPLQKIITINEEKGIYMIAYSDNKHARDLFPYIENKRGNCLFLERLLEKTLDLEEETLHLLGIKSFFWEEGTHYYSPIDKTKMSRVEFIREAQQPYKNIIVVGEAVSMNQGWINGALDSVELVLSKTFINNK